MVSRDHPAVRGAATGAPRLLDRHLLGLAPMAVIVMNDVGRVTHWTPVAAEIFGVTHDAAVGRPLRTLLRLPQQHREAFEPGGSRIRHPWTGVCLTPRVDEGGLREVAWWVYPLAGPGRARVLAIAADAQRLRDEGMGIALGDVMVAAPPHGPLTETGGVRVLRVEPTRLKAADADTGLLGRRLAEMLPPMPPEATTSVVRQVLSRGYPAVNVSVTARLPFAGHRGSGPRMTGVHPAQDSAERGPAAASVEQAAAQERLDFLNEVGARIVDTLDPTETATALCEAVVPGFADLATVHLLEPILGDDDAPPLSPVESPRIVRVAVGHDDPRDRWNAVIPVGERLRLPAGTPFTESLTSGRVINIPRVSERLARRISASFDRDLRSLLCGRAVVVAPLIARGRVLGNFILLRKADRPCFGDQDAAMVEELCRRSALCVDNGRLYRREAHAAAELQKTMLPDAPPVVAGARICYRYVPANEAVRVGGDWFDAIPLPGGRLALVVGDVMGHGLTSAAIMGQLRTAVRTLAAQGLPPDRLLRQLDDLACRLGDEYLATCIYVVYDPVARCCDVANAGHLPPVLVSPYGDSELIEVPPGAPIGVGGVAFETVRFDVDDGSRFVLCTDGLVERRGQGIDVGLTALRDHLGGPPRSLEGICDSLIDTFGSEGQDDDIALLAVRFEGIPKEDVASWTFGPTPEIVGRTRELARATLHTWGLAPLVDTVELLVSELVTNALRYGVGEIALRLIRADSLLCEVRDYGHELPALCSADVTDEHGRGLQLVSALAERWGAQRTATGKVVWFEHPM